MRPAADPARPPGGVGWQRAGHVAEDDQLVVGDVEPSGLGADTDTLRSCFQHQAHQIVQLNRSVSLVAHVNGNDVWTRALVPG